MFCLIVKTFSNSFHLTDVGCGGRKSVLFKTPACGLIILHMKKSVPYHLFKTSSDLEILGGGK